jgi:hypothetical protein
MSDRDINQRLFRLHQVFEKLLERQYQLLEAWNSEIRPWRSDEII